MELFNGSDVEPQRFEEEFGPDYRAYLQIKNVLNQTNRPVHVLTTDPKMPYYEQDERWRFEASPDFERLSQYTHLVIAPWWSAEDYERLGISYSELQAFLRQKEYVKKIFEVNGYRLFQVQFGQPE